MATADVAEAALRLSNLRNRLNQAVTGATRRVFLGLTPPPAVVLRTLHDLMEEVDQVYDELTPFAFYTDQGTERLLGLSVAVAHARGGDARAAGEALVALFDDARKAA